jgi:hypothetical protein
MDSTIPSPRREILETWPKVPSASINTPLLLFYLLLPSSAARWPAVARRAFGCTQPQRTRIYGATQPGYLQQPGQMEVAALESD